MTARTAKTLERVRELGFADRIEADPARAVEGADCVMLCAPVGAFADIAAAIAPHLAPGAVLTDVGSTKQSVIRDVGPLVPAGVHFVPAHPVAGTEYSGPDSGFTTLFEGRWTLLTPPPGTDEAAVAKVEELWRRCGSMVQRMEPGHHDRVLAIVSHLPHLIAFTICGTADDLADESRQEVLQFRRLGVPRFHPDRRQRPGDVAGHFPQQPRGAAGDAGAVHGGRAGDVARGALGGRGVYRGQGGTRAEDPPQPDRAEAGVGRASRRRPGRLIAVSQSRAGLVARQPRRRRRAWDLADAVFRLGCRQCPLADTWRRGSAAAASFWRHWLTGGTGTRWMDWFSLKHCGAEPWLLTVHGLLPTRGAEEPGRPCPAQVHRLLAPRFARTGWRCRRAIAKLRRSCLANGPMAGRPQGWVVRGMRPWRFHVSY